MSNHTARKILRVLLWIFGVLFGLVLLIVIAIQLPPVQRWLTDQVESTLQDRLNTDLGIGSIGLEFPKALAIRDVYINTPQGDSLFRLGELAVDINMLRLFKREVVIQSIGISDVYGNVIITDSTSNIAFLLDALVPTDTAATLPPDTSATAAADTALAWQILFPYSKLSLENIDLYYQDDPTGMLLDLEVGSFYGDAEDIDLTANRYVLDRLELNDSRIKFHTGPSQDTSAAAVLDYYLSCGLLAINNTSGQFRLDTMDIGLYLESTKLRAAELMLGETITFSSPAFALNKGAFTFDQLRADTIGSGIDYNHLALAGIEIDLQDILYRGDTILARINQLQAREKSGLEIVEAQGTILYAPTALALENLLLRTPYTRISSPATQIDYDFLGAPPLETLAADVDLKGYIGLRDALLLAPQLRAYPSLRENADRSVQFTARARGNGQAMDIRQLYLDGPGVVLRANGDMRYPFDPERVEGTLLLSELSARPRMLLPLVPAGMLPPGIDWPERIVADGRFEYADDGLTLRLFALEERFASDLLSRVRAGGSIYGVQAYPRTRLDITLDTLLVTRRTLLAYLPPSAIPEGYQLPTFVRGSGTIAGPMENLDVDLRLDLPGGNTFARARGSIANITDPEQLRLDMELSDLSIAAADVSAILPDSLLPDYFNLPDLRISGARISGGLEDLTFDLPIESSNGQWNLVGRYNPRDLDIQARINGLDPKMLFSGPLRDSIAQLNLQPLDLRAMVVGQLEPTLDVRLNATIIEQGRGEIVTLAATAVDQTYEGSFAFSHPDLRGQGSGFYSLGPDSVATARATFDLDRLDLRRWNLSDADLLLSGEIAGESQGLTLDNMSANLRMNDILLRSDTSSSFVDSLVATAELQNGTNDVQVRSDLLDLSVTGQFAPAQVFDELVVFIRSYWEEQLPDINPVIHGNMLDLTFNLKKPRVLTGGLVPGLRELSPLQAKLVYRDRAPELVVDLDLARLNYAGTIMDSLVFDAVGDTAGLRYQADWRSININEQIILGRTRFGGYTDEDAIRSEFTVWNSADSVQHQLAFLVDPETDSISLRMAQDQIINYQTWNVPAGNLILIAGTDLLVRNWALESQGQRLAMETTAPNELEVTFDDFEIATITRLLQSEEELASGRVNGEVNLQNVLTNLEFRSDLTVDDLRVMSSPLGQLALQVSSPNGSTFVVDADLTGEGNQVFIDGAYQQNGTLDLRLDADRLQMQTLEAFSAGFLQNTEGYLTGAVDVGGNFNSPRFDGQLRFQDAALDVSILGTRFRLNEEPVLFNGQRISLSNLTVYDNNGNQATVNGGIILRSIADYAFDLSIRARDFLAIDSDEDDNDLYYGRLVLDADITISGDVAEPIVELSATPKDNSRLVYRYSVSSLKSGQSAEGTVRFVAQSEWDRLLRVDEGQQVRTGSTGFTLIANLNVNPDLRFTIVLDPITGDQFTGAGTGDISFRQYPDGRMEMTGQVEVVEGTYNFTYAGVISREFSVVPGSTLTWTGDVINPEIDLGIQYRIRTSPYPLVSNYTVGSLPNGIRRDQTFDVVIKLDGDLQGTSVNTNVTYPDIFGNNDFDAIEESLVALRADQSQLNQQAFGLLLFNSFINQSGTPDEEVGGLNNTINSTLDNVLTTQLNNLANRYLGFVEVDFGVETFENGRGGTERNVRLSLSKSILNDRVILSIDGVASTGEGDESASSQTYLDNITAEFLINESGNLRLKLFNDRDRSLLVNGEVIRVGGRLVFSKDFETIRWFKGNKTEG